MSQNFPPSPTAAASAAPTVFLVDDDDAVLKSLGRLMRSTGLEVAAFSSPRQFLEHYDARIPGCLVLDVAMPGLDGLALQAALVARDATLPIIFLTGHGDIPMSVQAMKRGALDFLTKPVDDEALLRAIRLAFDQNRRWRATQAELEAIRARLDTLTPREREVLGQVISGRLNKQIAADLGTVEATIKVHRARVMEKMKVQSLAELVRLAEQGGIKSQRPAA